LIDGPGSAKTADLERTLRRTHYRDSVSYVSSRPSASFRPGDAYVADYLFRFDRTWRIRAALGLGVIADRYGPPASVRDSLPHR